MLLITFCTIVWWKWSAEGDWKEGVGGEGVWKVQNPPMGNRHRGTTNMKWCWLKYRPGAAFTNTKSPMVREDGGRRAEWLHVGGDQHVFILSSITVSISVYWHPHSPASRCVAFLCNGNARKKFYFAACSDVFIGVAAGHWRPSDYLQSRLRASCKKNSSNFVMWDSLMWGF